MSYDDNEGILIGWFFYGVYITNKFNYILLDKYKVLYNFYTYKLIQ